jgi:integrase
MAINLKEYKTTKEQNIKVHKKDIRLFLFDFRINNKRYRKNFKVKATNHTPSQMLKTARTELDNIKDEIKNGTYGNSLIKLDMLFTEYMETQPLTDWTHKKKHIYDLYIGNSQLSNITKEPTPTLIKKRESFNRTKIGYKSVGDIIERDILSIISKMEKEHNLSPRTQKIILEVLNPVFDYAIRNRYLTESPTTHITIKIPSQKKIVTNATELFKRVYIGIIEYYHEEPFYKALFLFAFTGRRKSEILNLKWENIDFTSSYYWIEDTKNGDKQRYKLSPILKVVLLELLNDRVGLVFKSPITGKKIINLDRHIKKLRQHTKVDNLTLHYMRNILVSALAEQGTEAITLSGILGHKDINTINKYLSNPTMKSSIKGLETIDKILEAEIIE